MNVKKLVEKMHNQPNGIRMEEAHKVLEYYGYRLVRQKGSHRQYLHSNGDLITVKEDSLLKKVYVIDILGRIGE